jgi:hypothetical protein
MNEKEYLLKLNRMVADIVWARNASSRLAWLF